MTITWCLNPFSDTQSLHIVVRSHQQMKNQPDPEAIVSGILAGLALAGFNLQARRLTAGHRRREIIRKLRHVHLKLYTIVIVMYTHL